MNFCHLHLHTEYCLAGDTIIYNCIQNGKKNRKDYTLPHNCKTIKYLYEAEYSKERGRTAKKYPIKVWNGSKFVRSKIKKISRSCPKQLYEILTENGKKIRTSKNHKFLSAMGWRRLSELEVGDLLACNGQKKYEDKEWLLKKYIEENLNQQQIADIYNVSRDVIKKFLKKYNIHKTKNEWMKGHFVSDQCRGKISKIKLEIRKNLINEIPSSLSTSRSRVNRRWYLEKKKCNRCESKKNLLIHHKDRDPINNKIENLEVLCKSCHEFEHARCPLTIRYEKIISIKKDKIEETYDIEVFHQSHNFIANGFVVHNSQLDGVGSPKQYAKRAKEMGFEYLAMTDHGNCDGAIQFQKACKAEGIKSVIGCEMYIVPYMDAKHKGEKRGHITVLVKDLSGWETLLRLLTKANLEGFYHKPRIDYESMLNVDLSGLIIMTACAGSFLHLDGSIDFLCDLIQNKVECYYEIMPHNIPAQEKIHKIIEQVYDEIDLPFAATNDTHYINRGDWQAQEVLLAIQSKAKWKDENRFKFGFKGLHLRSEKEMVRAFQKQGYWSNKIIKEAMDNTIKIAEKCCDFVIPKQDISLPEPPGTKHRNKDHITASANDNQELSYLIYSSNKEPLLENKIYSDRLDYEFDIISQKGFSRYFLIVVDLLNWCDKNDIMFGPGRGCFTPDSKIICSSHNKIEYKNISSIETGDNVICHDGTTNKVIDKLQYDIEEEIIEIETIDGRIIECTLDHKIMTDKGWIEAQYLNPTYQILDWRKNNG